MASHAQKHQPLELKTASERVLEARTAEQPYRLSLSQAA